MITERQGCVALGHPVPQGSMKCIGARGKVKHQIVPNDSTALDIWRTQVEKAAREYFTEQADQHQALILIAHVYVARPAKHYRTGRYSHLLRDDAPVYPTARQYGDTDKLLRAIGDALTYANVIHDDAQFVRNIGEKHFVTHDPLLPGLATPGAQIEVRPR